MFIHTSTSVPSGKPFHLQAAAMKVLRPEYRCSVTNVIFVPGIGVFDSETVSTSGGLSVRCWITHVLIGCSIGSILAAVAPMTRWMDTTLSISISSTLVSSKFDGRLRLLNSVRRSIGIRVPVRFC